MRLFGRVDQPVPEPEAPDAADAVPVDDETAVRAAAEQARTEAAQRRTEAETVVETARAKAARLVAEAEHQARILAGEAREAEGRAEQLEERAQYLAHADQLRDRIADTEQNAARLDAEAVQTAEQVEALAVRLEGLGVQREDATAALSAARDAGDVEGVQQQRAQLTAIDEVVKALSGQQTALGERLRAIGGPEDPAGEMARTLARTQAARMELRRVLNILDPERVEAQMDELLDVLQGSLEAQVAEMTQPPAPRPNPQVQHAPVIQEPPMATSKIDQLRKAAKAKAEDQVGVYDCDGNLIGLVDPDKVIPVAQMDDMEKQALAAEVFKGIRKRAQR
ncbi:hypothetical protein ABT186_05195 [Streptomyces sp. NPDC001634]|uniref:hypothetical protein n=1 Tax=Streptomyces sp. NPDC001634 TaxID=3154390 RepID=UPI0033234312